MYKYMCIRATCTRIFLTRSLFTYIHIYGTLAGISLVLLLHKYNDEKEKKEKGGDMYALELSCYE